MNGKISAITLEPPELDTPRWQSWQSWQSWECEEYEGYLNRIEGKNSLKIRYRISIRSRDNGACHDWRDFQAIKNALLGPEWEAVELYPAESRLVDPSNMYYLWCSKKQFPFGFTDGRKVGDVLMHEGINLQRPHE